LKKNPDLSVGRQKKTGRKPEEKPEKIVGVTVT